MFGIALGLGARVLQQYKIEMNDCLKQNPAYGMVKMKFWGTAVVVKRNKKLLIEVLETGMFLYTPPNFIRLHSRKEMQKLASRFTELQSRDIKAIMDFEMTVC